MPERVALGLFLCVGISPQLAAAQDCERFNPSDPEKYLKCEQDKDIKRLDAEKKREYEPILGKYFCVIENVAGIQQSDEQALRGQRPFVGRIHVPSEKFFIEISYSETSCTFLGSFFPRWNCKALYKLTSKDNHLIDGGFSADRPDNFFMNPPARDGTFRINNGRFTAFSEGLLSPDNMYVLTGKCEKIADDPRQ
jgi:hypothetical protein